MDPEGRGDEFGDARGDKKAVRGIESVKRASNKNSKVLDNSGFKYSQ